MMRPPTLSLCMIVKDEESVLGRCLDSVQGVVDEMIVVDTGSRDATPAIADAYRTVVIRHGWQNDFALARNVALAHASGDWVLMLDADEELDGHSRTRIRPTIADTDADGLRVRVRSFTPAGELQTYDDLWITRLFRNRPGYRYEQAIHEQIRPSIERQGGRVVEADLTILHHGYAGRTAQGQEQRAARNLKLLESALAASPGDPYLHYQLGVTHKALGNGALAYAFLCGALALDWQTLDDAVLDRLHMKLAQLALAQDEHDSAIAHAQRSLAYNPDNVISLYVVALASMARNDIRQAYRHFRRIRRSPGADLAHVGDLDAVLDYCRRILDE